MAALPNAQHEVFARELAELLLDYAIHGRDGQARARLEAQKRAGFASNPANARRLANRPEVKARVTELYRDALEYRDVRVAVVVNRIDRIGRANIVDLFERNEHGRLVLKDLTALPRELTDAIASIEWDDEGNPKLKLWDKNQANFTLLKHMGGMPAEQIAAANVNVNAVFAGLSVDDQRAIAEALEALPAGPQGAGTDASGEHRP
jgi:terminase small subunit-like protein